MGQSSVRDARSTGSAATGGELLAQLLAKHVANHHPLHLRRLGEEGVRKLVERVMARAPIYGVKLLDDHRRLLSLVTAYGEEFDQVDWVRRMLANPNLGSRIERLRHIYELARASDTSGV
jgi:hypothetical protein